MRGARQARDGERGSALLLALVLVALVAGLSAAMLRVTSSVTREQAYYVEDRQAFYLAEAALSEAYYGLCAGKTGQVGTSQKPARLGDGLVWVDATELADDRVRLESNALYRSGRGSLGMVFQRFDQPLGIFSNQDLVVDAPLLLDGFDSTSGTYFEQSAWVKLELRGEKDDDMTISDEFGYVRFEEGKFLIDGTRKLDIEEGLFEFAYREGTTFYLSPNEPILQLYGKVDYAIDSDQMWGSGGVFEPEVMTVFSESVVAVPGGESELGVHTGGGGTLGSNGSIELGGSVQIYGDVVPGPGAEVAGGGAVSGVSAPRAVEVELPEVHPPAIAQVDSIDHFDAIPWTLPPGSLGYDSIVVRPGSELRLEGPMTLVVDVLELEPGAQLVIDNAAGLVNLYITGRIDLAAGSVVTVESDAPPDMLLQVAGSTGSAELSATSQFKGFVYAPEAAVSVTEPFEIYGALVADSLDLGEGVRLHFDSGLYGGGNANYLPRFLSWEVAEMPAVLKDRSVDPMVLFQLEEEELEDASDAQESESWQLYFKYKDHDGKTIEYNGALEQFEYEDVSYGYFGTLKDPEVEVEGDWRVEAEYKDLFSTRTFSGTAQEFKFVVPWMKQIYVLRVFSPED